MIDWIMKILGWKWTAALIALVLAIAASLGAFSVWRVKSYQKSLETTQEALKSEKQENARLTASIAASQKAEKAREVIVTKIIAKEEKGRAKTEAALAKHRDWADQHVPDDVLDSLRQ